MTATTTMRRRRRRNTNAEARVAGDRKGGMKGEDDTSVTIINTVSDEGTISDGPIEAP